MAHARRRLYCIGAMHLQKLPRATYGVWSSCLLSTEVLSLTPITRGQGQNGPSGGEFQHRMRVNAPS